MNGIRNERSGSFGLTLVGSKLDSLAIKETEERRSDGWDDAFDSLELPSNSLSDLDREKVVVKRNNSPIKDTEYSAYNPSARYLLQTMSVGKQQFWTVDDNGIVVTENFLEPSDENVLFQVLNFLKDTIVNTWFSIAATFVIFASAEALYREYH